MDRRLRWKYQSHEVVEVAVSVAAAVDVVMTAMDVGIVTTATDDGTVTVTIGEGVAAADLVVGAEAAAAEDVTTATRTDTWLGIAPTVTDVEGVVAAAEVADVTWSVTTATDLVTLLATVRRATGDAGTDLSGTFLITSF